MKKNVFQTGQGGTVYALGLIGALVFYIGNASSFWMGVAGFFQALFWPAFLVHGLFEFLLT
ncbi:hypothetical protein GF369_02770 [Candidatus Peregrinibacteria bacterium]|nr:hypothetical protein [Candidatus Peregrinibacteria bacterium]